ncbi:hypothetical protein LY12_001287 [Prauserella alba]|uniref:Uncharacterized protein n=2 Tax=Prauserella alba TaxID=176898 RepID=A0ABN1VIU7_9PSEU|nr:hypothetical protein [Prauserella alba]
MARMTPIGLKNRAIARYEAETGRKWRDLGERKRKAWLARTEPLIRAELGIAQDAEWRDGAWHAPNQLDLLNLADTTEEVA